MANGIDYDLFKGPLITIGLIATAHVTNVATSALTVESTMLDGYERVLSQSKLTVVCNSVTSCGSKHLMVKFCLGQLVDFNLE